MCKYNNVAQSRIFSIFFVALILQRMKNVQFIYFRQLEFNSKFFLWPKKPAQTIAENFDFRLERAKKKSKCYFSNASILQ